MISVTILTKNSRTHLPKVLDSLRHFDEVLVLDTGSTDDTMELARSFPNVRLEQAPFEGFGPSHNRASSLARHDWILSVDSDEVLGEDLAREIQALSLDPNCVYSVKRRNLLNGKFIRHSGWYPDRCLRLYNRKHTSWTADHVHETIQTKGMEVCPLNGFLIHYSYSGLREFLEKMQRYSVLFAQQRMGRKPSSPCKAVLHAGWAFFKCYILQRGFLDGYEGLVISAYNSQTAFWKYLLLYEANSGRDSLM